MESIEVWVEALATLLARVHVQHVYAAIKRFRHKLSVHTGASTVGRRTERESNPPSSSNMPRSEYSTGRQL